MMRPAVPATRTSARIEARQGSTLPGWTVPTGNNDERRLMQGMIAHLQATDDVDDADLYRYLFKESDVIRNDLKNVKVFRRIRSQLAGFRVPFMQYDSVNRKWLYWNDFTLTGLTAWQDQTRDRQDEETSEDEDEDTVAANIEVADDTSTTTMEDQPALRDESEQPTAPSQPPAARALATSTTSLQGQASQHDHTATGMATESSSAVTKPRNPPDPTLHPTSDLATRQYTVPPSTDPTPRTALASEIVLPRPASDPATRPPTTSALDSASVSTASFCPSRPLIGNGPSAVYH